jgi:RimJ/RimL family protein N-acetyltransferase
LYNRATLGKSPSARDVHKHRLVSIVGVAFVPKADGLVPGGVIGMLLSGDLSSVEIISARLILRSTTAADGDEACAEANASVALFMSWNPPASRDEFGGIHRALVAQMVNGENLSLTVRLLETREFLGSAGLHSADADFLETGIWIKQSAQKRGYGREAVAAVVAWASFKFQPSGLLWPVVDENIASRRLVESLGGQIIGTRRRQKAGDAERTQLIYRIPAV